MSESFKVAVIGLKGVGTNHTKKLAAMDGVEVVAVCDIVKERAEQVAKEHNIPHMFTDYKEMLKSDFDVLVSCTGQYARRDHIVAAAKAGKHLFTEKPLAANLEDGQAIRDAVKAAGVKYQIGFQLRCSEYGRALKTVVGSGALGDLVYCWSHRNMPANHYVGPDGKPSWYGIQEKSGGIAGDFSPHDIDLMRWFCGDVKEVYARLHRARFEGADDNVWAIFTFANGATGSLGDSFTNTFGQSFIGVCGTKGTVAYDHTGKVRVKLWGDKEFSEPEKYGDVTRGGRIEHHECFFHDLREGREPSPNLDDGYAVLQISVAIQRSAASGQPVRIADVG
ncbi:MAG: Gfo/Idh/MocA family oxidoreductase [Planctomycetota bacterium]